MLAAWWCKRAKGKEIILSALVLIGSALVLPLIAYELLAMAMPAGQAFRGVLGSWPWVFDRRVTSLAFYQNINGLNDVAGNLTTMLDWCGVYAILLGFGVGAGLLIRPSNRTAARLLPAIIFLLLAGGIYAGFHQINWAGMITPLPVCLFFAGCVLARGIYRRPIDTARAALRLSLVVFSILLVAKMGLKPLVYQYGFVLAWPGAIVLVALVATELPAWITNRGGSGGVLRAIGLAAWLVAVSAILNRTSANFDAKRWTMNANTPDAIRIDNCGLEVQHVCDQIRELTPANGTVAVFPQGLMINYLSRRANPIRNVNFMPPEVLAVGEDAIIIALEKHPPDLIVVTSTAIEGGHFTLDGKDIYGAKMLQWIQKNYQPVNVVTLQKPLPTIYRFMISRRREKPM
jgi:hypothetical protein